MEVSEARRAANKANSTRSKGPTSERGKSISRRNSLKHGLTGEGVVLPEGDQAEVESRIEALKDELRPQSSLGSMLIRKIATLSVRSERAAERENAAIAERARNAVDAFDEERGRRVDALFDALRDDPRGALRNLRRMPEGVDRLIEAWRALRRDLGREGQHRWGSPQLARAANLAGVPHLDAHGHRIGDLSCAIWGQFHGLASHEGGDLDDEGRRDWARVALLELVDARIAELEAHRDTLDLDRIDQARREAPARSTFDDSKEASLARRYEADSDRGFYRALKEFRQVEADAAARVEAAPELPIPDPPDSRMGSFREATPPADRERAPAFLDAPIVEDPAVRGADGLPLSITRPLPTPVRGVRRVLLPACCPPE
jgi:hypothetical protein